MKIGIGTATFFRVSYAGADPYALIDAVDFAVDNGVAHIDTAPLYGFGIAEELLKGVIAGRRDQLVVISKCGFEHSPDRGYYFDASPAAIRGAVTGSVRRMGLDALDCAMLAYPGYVPQEELLEGWAELIRLKEQGVVKRIGVCNCTERHLELVSAIQSPAAVQLGYSAVARENENTIRYCAERGIEVITHGPRFYGVLVDTYTRAWVESLDVADCRRGMPSYVEPQISRYVPVVECLKEVGQRHGCSAAAAAIAFVLANPNVSLALMGARTREQVSAALVANKVRLTDEDVAEITQAVGPHCWSGWNPR